MGKCEVEEKNEKLQKEVERLRTKIQLNEEVNAFLFEERKSLKKDHRKILF